MLKRHATGSLFLVPSCLLLVLGLVATALAEPATKPVGKKMPTPEKPTPDKSDPTKPATQPDNSKSDFPSPAELMKQLKADREKKSKMAQVAFSTCPSPWAKPRPHSASSATTA